MSVCFAVVKKLHRGAGFHTWWSLLPWHYCMLLHLCNFYCQIISLKENKRYICIGIFVHFANKSKPWNKTKMSKRVIRAILICWIEHVLVYFILTFKKTPVHNSDSGPCHALHSPLEGDLLSTSEVLSSSVSTRGRSEHSRAIAKTSTECKHQK